MNLQEMLINPTDIKIPVLVSLRQFYPVQVLRV